MNLEEIVSKTAEYIDASVEFCKLVWRQPHAPELLGGALAALVLLVAVRKIKKAFKPIKLFDNRAGIVEVSRKALDELVQSVCYSLGALNRPDVKIYTRRGRLCMNVSLKLESGQSLTDATSEIQTALSARRHRRQRRPDSLGRRTDSQQRRQRKPRQDKIKWVSFRRN